MMDLEKINFENLVYYYAEGLRMIQAGESATGCFSTLERRRLKKRGVLERGGVRAPYSPFVLTEKAEKYLDSLGPEFPIMA